MKKKIIAFYLPQFHTIPENDYCWGKGFTEWTNVKKAKQLFKGHNQPRVPLDQNYYSLLDINTLKWQSRLMKKYSVYGLAVYHYWFKDGKKLLEKPLELLRDNTDIDVHYCLSWANENWTKHWDGGNNEIICEQKYGSKREWEDHFQYMLTFFKDKRYIKYMNRPMLIIYKPFLIPHLQKMIEYFNIRAKANGFEGVYIGYQYSMSKGMKIRYDKIFDFSVMFEPIYSLEEREDYFLKIIYDYLLTYINPEIRRKLRMFILAVTKGVLKKRELKKVSYDIVWNKILERKLPGGKVYPGAFVDWDNTPRIKTGMMFTGVTAEKFRYYFGKLIEKYNAENNLDNYLFINAWNEWGEGCYLEPDVKNQYSYLEAISEKNQ